MVGDHNNSYELLIHYTNKFSFLVRFALETKKEKNSFLVKRDNKKKLKNRNTAGTRHRPKPQLGEKERPQNLMTEHVQV